jgi:hypothetical protein
MAKRKGAGSRQGAGRARAGAKKAKSKATRSGATARKSKRAAAKRTATKRTARRAPTKRTAKRAATKRAAKRTATKRSAARAAARRTAKRAAPTRAATRQAAPKRTAAKRTAPTPAARKRTAARATRDAVAVRKAPSLNRERRVVKDEDDLVQSPPSSLDLERSASSARSGRRGLRDRYEEHTETGPAITGGDVDADWESAYSVGDEAPGGDNPTPDQDIVDDIGKAVGVVYQDNEELKGADKVEKRDKQRWELDPASSDDWEDR